MNRSGRRAGARSPVSGSGVLRQHARGGAFARGLLRCFSPEGARALRALGLLLEVDLRLRLGGFARLQRALRPVSHEQGSGLDPMESRVREALRMERALRQAARFFPRARCLHRSLALLLWLRRRGMTAELCIGLRHAGAAVEGHAWVKWGGVVLDEDPQVGHRFETLQKAG